MNLLLYQWKAYNYMDIADTLTNLGHTVSFTECTCRNDDEDAELEQYLIHLLSGGNYDALFSINYFTVLANACHAVNVPYISWNYDAPLISMYNKSVFHPTNYIFTFDKANYYEFRNMGVSHIYHLPLAGNCFRMDTILSTSNTSNDTTNCLPKPEISFIGNLYGRNEYDNLKHKLPDYLIGYFDAAIWAQVQISGGNILDTMLTPSILSQLEQYFHLEKAPASFSNLGLIFSTTVLGFKTARTEREYYLSALSRKHKVSLFTNAPSPQLPLVENCGMADYQTTTPFIYRNSKINLNFTIPNIRTGIPLRVFDILSAKGFLMTTYRPEIAEYFTPNQDLVIFEDKQELLEKTDYYLTHEDVRLSIAEHGYQTVRNKAAYPNRLKTILDTVFSSC